MNSTISKTNPTPTPPCSPPHPSTFFPDLKQCKTMRDLNQFHAKFIKTARIHDPIAAAELLRFCALSPPPHRDLRYARHLFHHMDQPNCFSWNTIIRALSESNDNADEDPIEAVIVFRQLVQCEFIEPNRFTFPSVLKACARTGRIREEL
ncbi:Pentatricopeptide repeat-containing protein [Camellia lanceoleosa]|uniref:Pentatricopeptide repeat-containing protein n=1 Tax=Camellia lanceoleosa TaxID=1840588 RepID=A0ACC0ILE6_9ERIC|nr:Pentatricopeptide repeat-containing protein [Camellia lanceoleosa]